MIKKKGNELRTKIMLIGENPDINFFTALQQEGYEAIAVRFHFRDPPNINEGDH
jgi:hypothetical protein